jgi:hypothetical protein
LSAFCQEGDVHAVDAAEFAQSLVEGPLRSAVPVPNVAAGMLFEVRTDRVEELASGRA